MSVKVPCEEKSAEHLGHNLNSSKGVLQRIRWILLKILGPFLVRGYLTTPDIQGYPNSGNYPYRGLGFRTVIGVLKGELKGEY